MAKTPGPTEAEPLCRIEFCLEKTGLSLKQEHECSITQQIISLKEDLKDAFEAPPKEQKWKYKGTEMDDELTLEKYGFKGDEKRDQKITVNIEKQ